MKTHRLRWALMCVAAAPGVLAASAASASHTVVIGPGDSVDSLARKYHVSTRDIARANGISTEAVLIDGHRLRIPDPPKTVRRASTMRRDGSIKGDRITVRMGPDESYRRIALLDHGASLVLTHRAGDWFQAELPNGATGWVRADFVSVGNRAPERVASTKRAARKKTHIARRDEDEEKPRARRRRHADEDEAKPTRRHRTRVASAKRSYDRARSSRRGRAEADAPSASTDVVRTAYSYRGVPYHFGGSGRSGFDCSGFTSYVYRRKGVSLPHSAADQYNHGRRVSRGDMKPGDLVFFHTTRSGISHVGIYAGSGKFVHASSGGGRVRVDSLDSGYYRQRFRGARRVK